MLNFWINCLEATSFLSQYGISIKTTGGLTSKKPGGMNSVCNGVYNLVVIISVCNDFLNKDNNHENIYFIIPPGFLDVKPPVVLTEIPYCDKKEVASKQFMKKFNKFTIDKYDISIKWLTRKMKTLFKLKDPCIHPACKIYKGVCICGETYIAETIQNVETRWKEHNAPSHKSNSSKHVSNHLDHIFT